MFGIDESFAVFERAMGLDDYPPYKQSDPFEDVLILPISCDYALEPCGHNPTDFQLGYLDGLNNRDYGIYPLPFDMLSLDYMNGFVQGKTS